MNHKTHGHNGYLQSRFQVFQYLGNGQVLALVLFIQVVLTSSFDNLQVKSLAIDHFFRLSLQILKNYSLYTWGYISNCKKCGTLTFRSKNKISKLKCKTLWKRLFLQFGCMYTCHKTES